MERHVTKVANGVRKAVKEDLPKADLPKVDLPKADLPKADLAQSFQKAAFDQIPEAKGQTDLRILPLASGRQGPSLTVDRVLGLCRRSWQRWI